MEETIAPPSRTFKLVEPPTKRTKEPTKAVRRGGQPWHVNAAEALKASGGEPTELDKLAVEANAQHELVESSVRGAFAAAHRAGIALTKAKAEIPHGEWLPWVKEHLNYSDRTAQTYMRVAKEIPNPQASAHLTLERALCQLAAKKDGDVKKKGDANGDTPVRLPASGKGIRKSNQSAKAVRAMAQSARNLGMILDYPELDLIAARERIDNEEAAALAKTLRKVRNALSQVITTLECEPAVQP